MVVWLLGISGAGKSTLGELVNSYLQRKGVQTYLIDGDEVRAFFNNDLGYEKRDRQENIKRIIYGAAVLEKNGVVPIVCNISPFEELRAFSREKMQNYLEIYLKKEISNAQKNDVKDVYKEHLDKTPLVGINVNFDEPTQSNLTLYVDKETIEESFLKIKELLNKEMNDE